MATRPPQKAAPGPATRVDAASSAKALGPQTLDELRLWGAANVHHLKDDFGEELGGMLAEALGLTEPTFHDRRREAHTKARLLLSQIYDAYRVLDTDGAAITEAEEAQAFIESLVPRPQARNDPAIERRICLLLVLDEVAAHADDALLANPSDVHALFVVAASSHGLLGVGVAKPATVHAAVAAWRPGTGDERFFPVESLIAEVEGSPSGSTPRFTWLSIKGLWYSKPHFVKRLATELRRVPSDRTTRAARLLRAHRGA